MNKRVFPIFVIVGGIILWAAGPQQPQPSPAGDVMTIVGFLFVLAGGVSLYKTFRPEQTDGR